MSASKSYVATNIDKFISNKYNIFIDDDKFKKFRKK